jgi:Tfp pilus assembly protein PilX
MIKPSLAHRRLAFWRFVHRHFGQRRSVSWRADEGQSLIFVMMISALVMIMMGTVSTALLSQIKPAKASQDTASALAAAEAGIEDFVSWVNTHCPAATSYNCPALASGLSNPPTGVTNPTTQRGVRVTGADAGGATQSFYWTVKYAASGFARVMSVGQVPLSGATGTYRTKTLIADVNATPSFNNLQYFTKYETYAPDFLDSFYAARNIQVTSKADLSNTSLAGSATPGVVSWNGVCTYVDATTTPSCDPNHDTGICSDLYYPSSIGPGRGSDAAWTNSVRRPSATVQANMGTNNSFAYFSELGSYKPNASSTQTAVTHNDTCDTSFEPNMVMSGPVYSQDAYLADRGLDTGNSKNSMPQFGDNAYSVWNGTINGSQTATGANGGYYRSYPGTNGQVVSAVTPFPTYTSTTLDLPSNATSAPRSCTYTGPTRILIQQQYAYVTSPGTPTATGSCYTSTGPFVNVHSSDSRGQDPTDASGGVVNAKVAINSTTIYVKNPASSVTPTLATRTSPIFNLATNVSIPANSTSNGLAGSWTTKATYPSAVPCPLSPADPTVQRNLDCETGLAANPKSNEDVFTDIKNAVNTELAATPTIASLKAAVTGQLKAAALVAPNTVGGIYYTVAVTQSKTPTTTTTTAPAAMNPTDSFYQAANGSGYSTSTTTWNIAIDRNVCTSGGTCSKTSTSAVVSGAVTKATNTALSGTLNSAASFPWFGAQSGPNTYTDMNNDVTPYYHGYGDAYVEGTLHGQLSIVAEHDIVATKDLVYSNTNTTSTTDGLALVATHDVRVYRPMTCTDDGTAGATSLGSCPDDLTGTLTSALSWPLPNNLPSNMYKLDNAPSIPNGGTGQIDASIFALRGSFLIDNFYRGAVGSTVNITGGLYQYHRGPTSLPYQNRPFQGSNTKMPGMTLTYTYDNMQAGQNANGGLRVPWIPNPSGKLTNRTWNTISISSSR